MSKQPPAAGTAKPTNTAQPSTSAPANSIPIVRTRDQLDAVLKDAGNKVVLIEFYAEWCGPCKLISTTLDSMAEQYKERAVFVKVDVDEMEEYALQSGVSALPACLYLKAGARLDFMAGSDVEKIKKMLEKYVNPDKDAIKTVKR